MKRKWLAVGIILMFVGVAIAPSININVVKASNDNDLVEVTTQAYGVEGFGNTTVRLSHEDLESLRQYFVSFNARVNASSSSEETVLLYKDAVREMHDYRLLPKGLSQKQAERLVLGWQENPRFARYLERVQSTSGDDENGMCMIRGCTTNTLIVGPLATGIFLGIVVILKLYILSGNEFLYELAWFSLVPAALITILSNFNPVQAFSIIILGFGTYTGYYGLVGFPAAGWIQTSGMNGKKNWSGSFYGGFDVVPFSGIVGFTGFQIHSLFNGDYYIGHAVKVKIKMV
jgi:hypothetical protein